MNLALRWALFLGIAALVAAARLLPLGPGSGNWPGPNITICFAMIWVLRRPEYLPALLVAIVALAEDFVFMRPPGLTALTTLLAVEFLRSRALASREWPVMIEFGVVNLLMAGMLVAERLILAILLVPQPALGLELQQYISTMLFYPVAMLISVYVLKITHPRPGQNDLRGAYS